MAVPLPEVRDKIRGYLENDDLIWDLDTFFTVIKCSGIMDKHLIDNYFQTSLQLVECEKQEVKNLGLMLLSLNSFNNGFYRNPAIVDKMADILENSIQVNKPRHRGQNGGYFRK
ncbi:uncharacterized protein LOC111696529 [Eurytemora carolleeae]|uniref:uncharacterized protein LOC111696529 n=1 Tax=Eurytemora carolleeae TaxID=1294199 RepID=UPI000C760847|nr:uncharacterized protein LOC111696529 [Eurytemora carolleeae]|eukprot:XP_023321917.1 uncharacterized protein LOC111696529 [Eurytemora affinis]